MAMAGYVVFLLTAVLLVSTVMPKPYVIDDEDVVDEYNGRVGGNFPMDKRGCLPRGAGCDTRPNDCCDNSACRCNLWGTNCRCQRAGLLQKWGKK